jgi:hypothetical protein
VTGIVRKSIVACALAGLLVPGIAAAQGGYDTDPTREQWVDRANSICKKPVDRGEERLRKIGPLTKRGRYPRAGRILISVARMVFDLYERVAAIDRPPADDDAIAAYLRGERRGAALALKSGKALKQVKIRKAIKLLERAVKVTDKANKNVRGWGLRQCW